MRTVRKDISGSYGDNRMKKLALAFAAGLAVSAAQVWADEAAVDTQFKALDADQNGVITEQEATQAPEVAKAFKKLDVNKDGQLTKEEFAGLFA
ncbi:MAG: calmodulin [Gammaproteobacteria bacterium]|nr:MAG: calmodulin [Gammaproteobacteria bacterium]